MGYYFSLSHANLLSNLIDGNLNKLKLSLYSDETERVKFRELLNDLGDNIITNNPSVYQYLSKLILDKMDDIHDGIFGESIQFKNRRRLDNSDIREKTVYELIDELSKTLKSFDYKFLILKNRNPDEKLLENIITHSYKYKYSGLFLQPQDLDHNNFSLLDTFIHFDKALLNIDNWPGILIWKNKKKAFFIKCDERRSIEYILARLSEFGEEFLFEMEFEDKEESLNYIFHFSDLHIGATNIQKKLNRLKQIYRKKLNELEDNAEIDFVFTGDSVDDPNDAAVQSLEGFIDDIVNDNGKEPHIILGNHDIDNHGYAFNVKKKKIVAISSEIQGQKIIELKNNIVMIPFNSNISEKQARGMIGDNQLAMFGSKLDRLNLDRHHLKIALLHHHVNEIPHPDWRRKTFYEKLFPNVFESSLKLVDADNFKEWIMSRNIKVVLHGHKHIPFYDDQSIENSIIVSCGSSTGKVNHVSKGKTYLSYNLIKISPRNIVVNQYVEELLGAGEVSILTANVER